MFGDETLIKTHRKRSLQLANIIFLCFIIILIRLWYLQVYKGEIFYEFSLKNKLRKEAIAAPRGIVFDQNKKLLIDNRPRFDLVITPQYFQNKENTLALLTPIIDMKEEEILKTLEKYSYQAKYRPIIIKKNISFEEVSKIEEINALLPGVSVDTFISRDYLYKDVGAHLLGYVSEITPEQLPKYQKRDNFLYRPGDYIGQTGLEQQYNKFLRGKNGFEYVEVDALGRKKKYINTDNLFRGISDEAVEPGKNVFLTIDQDLQLAAKEGFKEFNGSLVAIEVDTGKVLAMYSSPSFDPTIFSRGVTSSKWNELVNHPGKPLRNRSVQDHFSPGSTFKPFTAITALENGLIHPDTEHRCHGIFRLGRRTYRSWKRWGKERVNVVGALQQSCNIFFYKLGADLKIDDIAKTAKMFGLSQRTGIDLPREVSGLIPTEDWKMKTFGKPWQGGETLSCSIGQSYILTTTIQLANAYAAIANKGKLFKPYIVQEIRSFKGELIKKYEPELIRNIELKDSTWTAIHQGLYDVVNTPKGTAFWRRGKGNQMAGKTGTSQVVKAKSEEQLYSKCSEMEYEYRHHGVFVGFAPYDSPKIAVAAIAEHGCGGSSAAAPIVEKVVNKYMKKYLPEKQKEYEKIEREQLIKYLQKRNAEKEKQNQENTTENEE